MKLTVNSKGRSITVDLNVPKNLTEFTERYGSAVVYQLASSKFVHMAETQIGSMLRRGVCDKAIHEWLDKRWHPAKRLLKHINRQVAPLDKEQEELAALIALQLGEPSGSDNI